MKPFSLLPALLLCAFSASATDKPAAVEVCLRLPEGMQLFASGEGEHLRALSDDTWMLDFDVLLNGRPITRLSRGTADCLLAWLPAERLRHLALDFSRLSLNPTSLERAVDIKLRPGRMFPGGTFVVAHEPWSTATSSQGGDLVFERQSPMGPTVAGDLRQLSGGKYVVKYTPADSEKSPCAVRIDAVGSGTVRADRNEAVFADLVGHYRDVVLPVVIKKHKLRCQRGESVQLSLRVVDGIFKNPVDPPHVRVQNPEEVPRYQLVVDGHARAFESGQTVEVGFGQQLVLAPLEQRASR